MTATTNSNNKTLIDKTKSTKIFLLEILRIKLTNGYSSSVR